ncbi:MAG: hypothetical protein JO021_21575, partial [Alphaproteobacteria bacterium]|nr:hypothetical protein [Alphaproteobacteria bacterium]
MIERRIADGEPLIVELRHTVALKILCLLLPLTLVIVAATLGVAAYVHHRDAVDALGTRGRLMVELQAAALAGPLWNLDMRQVGDILAAMTKDPDFRAAAITAPDGAPLARQGNLPDSALLTVSA